VDVDN